MILPTEYSHLDLLYCLRCIVLYFSRPPAHRPSWKRLNVRRPSGDAQEQSENNQKPRPPSLPCVRLPDVPAQRKHLVCIAQVCTFHRHVKEIPCTPHPVSCDKGIFRNVVYPSSFVCASVALAASSSLLGLVAPERSPPYRYRPFVLCRRESGKETASLAF